MVQIALKGKNDDALATAKFLTSYTDGQPQQYMELDFTRKAIREGEKHGMDPQALMDTAVRIDAELREAALREDAQMESDD